MALVAPTGTKTVTTTPHPGISTTTINTILALPIESLTLAQFRQIEDLLHRIPSGTSWDSTVITIGSLLH
jgi:hypothetical protein